MRAVWLSAIVVVSMVVPVVGTAALVEPAAASRGTSSIVVDNDFTTSNATHKRTIQAAVDAASASDTIRVRVGTYNEQVNIDKGLTLTSAAGPNETIITKDVDGRLTGVINA